jgi:dTDP-alpha-D-glucose dehydrogenase
MTRNQSQWFTVVVERKHSRAFLPDWDADRSETCDDLVAEARARPSKAGLVGLACVVQAARKARADDQIVTSGSMCAGSLAGCCRYAAARPVRRSSDEDEGDAVRFLPDDRQPIVAILGFGYVGSCIGAVLAGRGIRVFGIDNDPELVAEMAAGHCRFNEPGLAEALQAASATGILSFSTDYSDVASADVVVIAVGTPVDGRRRIVTDHLESVCASLGPYLRPGQLVILKSTVSPGTTQTLVRPLLEKGGMQLGRDFGLAFCPERLAEGSALAQFVSIPMVIGGCDEESAAAAEAFWSAALGVEVVSFGTPDVAELVKLADNWWIDANVALANELAKLCGALGVDVLDVISGANSLPKGNSHVNILLPSVGVGGSCLTKDPWILWTTGQQQGIDLRIARTAREVNDAMPLYTHSLILDGLTELAKDTATAKVAVLGLAFKNNTNDLRSTPVLPVVNALKESVGTVAIFDPLVAREYAVAEFGIEPSASLAEAVENADCVAVLAGHDEFKALDLAELASCVSMPCLIIDGRAYYPRTYIKEMRSLGFAYRGVGR